MHQRSIHDVHGPPSAVADASNAHEAKQVLCAEPRGELLKKTLEARLRRSFQRGHTLASSVRCGGWGRYAQLSGLCTAEEELVVAVSALGFNTDPPFARERYDLGGMAIEPSEARLKRS